MSAASFLPGFRALLGPCRRLAHHPLRRATLAQIENTLAPALPGDLLARPAAGPHSRRRVFDLSRTFWSWVWQILQGNASCREVALQLQALLGLLDHPPVQEGTSAYCQARAKLPLTMLHKAFAASGQSAERFGQKQASLQGRALKVVDGSSLRLPDTVANRQDYPLPVNQFKCPGFPVLRVLVLFSLASGAILAQATGSLQTAEVRLLLSLAGHLSSGDIILADRAYGQFVLAYWLKGLGVDLLSRLNARSRHVDFRRATRRLGKNDALFTWSRPLVPSKLLSPEQWEQVPKTLVVRILCHRFHKAGFRTREIWLVTTLLDPKLYPAEELLAAYARRWRLEMCLDDLKTTLGMEMLHCKTPDLVRKELLVFLLAHNLLRWIMGQAAKRLTVDLERLSFKGAMDALRQWTQALAQARGRGRVALQNRLWCALLNTLATDLVPLRPGRKEPRAIKKRNKYPPLTKERHLYIERSSRNKRRRVARAKKKGNS